jgi:hypothetical protein
MRGLVGDPWYHDGAMKLLLFLCASAVAAATGELAQVHTVYILSMSGGLDLHIANRLTDGHVLQVVTDPQKADAILTDKIGPGFEDRMLELYPPPEPPKPQAKDKDKDKDKEKDKPSASALGIPDLSEASNRISTRPVSSFGGGRGTVFLVSVKSRDVLWSTYAKPKDARGQELEKTAGRICGDLKKSLGAK